MFFIRPLQSSFFSSKYEVLKQLLRWRSLHLTQQDELSRHVDLISIFENVSSLKFPMCLVILAELSLFHGKTSTGKLSWKLIYSYGFISEKKLLKNVLLIPKSAWKKPTTSVTRQLKAGSSPPILIYSSLCFFGLEGKRWAPRRTWTTYVLTLFIISNLLFFCWVYELVGICENESEIAGADKIPVFAFLFILVRYP